jgi:hypothetical protein
MTPKETVERLKGLLVFPVLSGDFEVLHSAIEKIEAAEKMAETIRYLADKRHWDTDGQTGFYKLIRPGGARQEGIMLYSLHVNPWDWLAAYHSTQEQVKPTVENREGKEI